MCSMLQKKQGINSKMKYIIKKGDVTRLMEDKIIGKLNIRLAFMDPPYTLGKEGGMTTEELEQVIVGLKTINTAPVFTFIVFCGHQQSCGFYLKLLEHFPHVEKIYWFKPNHRVSGFNRHANQVLFCISLSFIYCVWTEYRLTAKPVDYIIHPTCRKLKY